MGGAGIYAGWVVVNLHLLVFLLLLSAGLSTLVTLLAFRRRVWHEYLSLSAALFLIFFVASWLICQFLLSMPVVTERDFFPLR